MIYSHLFLIFLDEFYRPHRCRYKIRVFEVYSQFMIKLCIIFFCLSLEIGHWCHNASDVVYSDSSLDRELKYFQKMSWVKEKLYVIFLCYTVRQAGVIELKFKQTHTTNKNILIMLTKYQGRVMVEFSKDPQTSFPSSFAQFSPTKPNVQRSTLDQS